MGLMPQWDFLNFIAEQARRYPAFHLRMQAEVTRSDGRKRQSRGSAAKTPAGDLEVRADLTVGADGRHSLVRERAGLEVINLGAPMDVLWMRLSRHPTDPGQTFGRFDSGRILVLLNREDYWQIAYVIPKGTADELRQQGCQHFARNWCGWLRFCKTASAELKRLGRQSSCSRLRWIA